MRHPKRTITRAIRTRRPLHPGREADELEALQWPGAAIRVRDRMSRGVATIHSDALVRGAAEMMRTRRIRHLPVVNREGRLVGIVTDRDLRQVIFDPSIQGQAGAVADTLGRLTVREVMTWGVVTARPDTTIGEAARRMHEKKIGALPVVEGDRVVGIVTESDILKAFQDVLAKDVLAKPFRWAFAYR
ncbi:MAG TPA: CBS domain-containing protein [Methylomirabilota bacterium]|nr:CBS domain-containing protein [Methylomirabilota bacterium]